MGVGGGEAGCGGIFRVDLGGVDIGVGFEEVTGHANIMFSVFTPILLQHWRVSVNLFVLRVWVCLATHRTTFPIFWVNVVYILYILLVYLKLLSTN